jgi:predicted PurR-regulated permease PerM
MRGVNRVKSIFTVYTAGLLLAGLFLALFVPALSREARAFGKIIPVYADTFLEFQDYLDHLSERVSLPGEARQILRETSGRIRNGILRAMRDFMERLFGLVSLLPSFILAPFLTYYFLKDFEHLKKRALAMLPPGCRNDIVYLLREADLIFSRFLRGHLLISLMVGFLTGVGAALIGLPFSILIGIFTAIADLIPLFGPLLAAVPVIGLALAESRLKGFLMLIIFLLVQQLEGSVLVPRLLGDRVGLHPLAIVFILLAGGYLFGPVGLILAVPVAGLLRVALKFLWAKAV